MRVGSLSGHRSSSKVVSPPYSFLISIPNPFINQCSPTTAPPEKSKNGEYNHILRSVFLMVELEDPPPMSKSPSLPLPTRPYNLSNLIVESGYCIWVFSESQFFPLHSNFPPHNSFLFQNQFPLRNQKRNSRLLSHFSCPTFNSSWRSVRGCGLVLLLLKAIVKRRSEKNFRCDTFLTNTTRSKQAPPSPPLSFSLSP